MTVSAAYAPLVALLALPLSAFGATYVLGDSYKVLPDGTILEFDRKPPGGLMERNAIWEAKTQTVKLAGARNEVVAFQIVLDGPAADLTLEVRELNGPGRVPAEAITFHLIGYVEFKGAHYPDLVIPMTWKGLSPFAIPYSVPGLPRIAAQKVGVVMVEVKIPKTVPAGNYLGELFIKGGIQEALKVSLTVWDFEMPDRSSILLDFNSYGSPLRKNSSLDHQGNPYLPTPDNVIQAEHEFYRCANRHRAYLNILPFKSQRGSPHYAPMLIGSGKEVKCDWTHWDKRFGPVLDGSVFEDGVPPANFYLPFTLHWPWGYGHSEKLEDKRLNFRAKPEYHKDHARLIPPDYLDEWDAVARQMVGHFAEKKWLRTTFQVYLNHSNDPDANCPWRLDEPNNRWDYQVLASFANLTHRIFNNSKSIPVKFRMDIYHFYCRSPGTQCYKAKNYELPLEQDGGGPQILEPAVDQWYVTGTHAWGNRDRMLEVGAKDANKEMYIYSGGQEILDPGSKHRGLFWALHEHKAKGYCAWKEGCADPSVPLASGGNGYDHVWYQGEKLGRLAPVPSLRMKGWRRGSFDAEYLVLAERKASPAQVREIVRGISAFKEGQHEKYIQVKFPFPNNNPEDYETARWKLASMILGKDIASNRTFSGRISGPHSKVGDEIRE